MKKRWLPLFLALCLTLCAMPVALSEALDAMDAQAVDAEVAIADETGAEGLVMDDGDADFVEETAADIDGTADPSEAALSFYGWQHDGYGWWYRNEDGTYPFNTWKKIDGIWYYFGTQGYMHTGWLKDGDKWYYLNSSGAMVANTTINIGGTNYTFDANGAWVPSSGGGWKQDGHGWRYENADGSFAKNCWKKINGTWYHFDPNGIMQTGWLEIDDCWYYFKGSGAMHTGWLHYDGDWYYMDASGAMQLGRTNVNGTYYYFDEDDDGAMVTDMWIKENGDLYSYGSDGAYEYGEMYYGNIYFLVDCYGNKIRNKIDPSLVYSKGYYLNAYFAGKCNSSGLIRNVTILDDASYNEDYHLFGVRPGMTFYSAVDSIQEYGFRQTYKSKDVYMYRSDEYAYPLYIIKDGLYISSITYGDV